MAIKSYVYRGQQTDYFSSCHICFFQASNKFDMENEAVKIWQI